MNLLNMIKFQFKLMIKTPVMLLSFFIYPVLLTAIIGYLTQNSFGGEISSYQYYSISMMIFIFSGAGLSSVYNFMDKPIKEGNLRLMFTPIRNIGIYLSQIITGTIFNTIGIGFSMILFKMLFKVNYNGNAALIFLAFVALSFMSNALGVFLCTVIDDVGPINMIFNMLQAILCVLGGAFVSIEALGDIPAALSKLSPVKWLMDGLLNSMYDNDNFLLFITIGVNIVLAIMLIGLCTRTFKTEKYL